MIFESIKIPAPKMVDNRYISDSYVCEIETSRKYFCAFEKHMVIPSRCAIMLHARVYFYDKEGKIVKVRSRYDLDTKIMLVKRDEDFYNRSGIECIDAIVNAAKRAGIIPVQLRNHTDKDYIVNPRVPIAQLNAAEEDGTWDDHMDVLLCNVKLPTEVDDKGMYPLHNKDQNPGSVLNKVIEPLGPELKNVLNIEPILENSKLNSGPDLKNVLSAGPDFNNEIKNPGF